MVGFSGIVGGAPVLGMAHRLLPALGVGVDAGSVGLHYGSRTSGGVLDVWAMDTADADAAEPVRAAGLVPVVTDLIMSDRGNRRVHRVRGQVRHRVISIFAPRASARSTRRPTWPRCWRPRWRRTRPGRWPTATSSSSPRRSSARLRTEPHRPRSGAGDHRRVGADGRPPGLDADRPHRTGLVLAAAGVDNSTWPPGTVLRLPVDPDASAVRLRDALQRRTGVRVGVVVSDTAGRAWRVGQTDQAIGAAGSGRSRRTRGGPMPTATSWR